MRSGVDQRQAAHSPSSHPVGVSPGLELRYISSLRAWPRVRDRYPALVTKLRPKKARTPWSRTLHYDVERTLRCHSGLPIMPKMTLCCWGEPGRALTRIALDGFGYRQGSANEMWSQTLRDIG